MMGTPLVITWGQVVSLVVLVLVAGLVAGLWRRRSHTLQFPAIQQIDNPDPLAGLAEEVAMLRTQVRQLQQELDAIKASRAAAAAQPNYSQAIDLARQGQPVVEVANRCGISRAEAELIVAMHGGKDKT